MEACIDAALQVSDVNRKKGASLASQAFVDRAWQLLIILLPDRGWREDLGCGGCKSGCCPSHFDRDS